MCFAQRNQEGDSITREGLQRLACPFCCYIELLEPTLEHYSFPSGPCFFFYLLLINRQTEISNGDGSFTTSNPTNNSLFLMTNKA